MQGSNFDTRPFWQKIPVSIFRALLYHDSSYLIGFKPRQNTSTFSNLVTQFDINNGRFNAAPYTGTYSRQCNQFIPTRTLDLIPKNHPNLFHHLSFFFLAACAMLVEFLKSSSEPGSRALNSYVNKKSFLALTHFGMHTGNGAHWRKYNQHFATIVMKGVPKLTLCYLIVPQSTIFLPEYSCAAPAHNHITKRSITAQCKFEPFQVQHHIKLNDGAIAARTKC